MIEIVLERLLVVVPLWLSLAVHEWAHAFAANQLGDDTARLQGRMTLDPTRHIDPLGTLALPLMGVPFGWAKPVPVNPLRFRGVHLGTGMVIAAAAGPASNLALAALTTGLYLVLDAAHLLDVLPGIRWLLGTMVPLNLVLALFNLLPIPPLDGGRIADELLPRSLHGAWAALSGVGPVLLIVGVVGLEMSGWGPISSLFAWTSIVVPPY